jgi:hypothetical protein
MLTDGLGSTRNEWVIGSIPIGGSTASPQVNGGLRPRSQGPIRLRIGPCGRILGIHRLCDAFCERIQGIADLVQLAVKQLCINLGPSQ